jgi:serine/threonine protein phosphatase 1
MTRSGIALSRPARLGPHTGAKRMNIFRKLLQPTRKQEIDAAAGGDMRRYAIGDVHGRLDLLDTLSQLISADLQTHPPQKAMTVFLGDYIDRGDNSAGVLDRLAKGDFPTSFVALRGNHEATMLDFLDDESVLGNWRQYGGLETLLSYGVDVREAMRGRDFKTAQESLRRRLPDSHLKFLNETKYFHEDGDYYFCHAGVRPLVSLAKQSEQDLMWIRDEFLNHRAPFGKIVVHGHTPADAPENLPNRINVDTGAYATGKLTCVALDGLQRRFLST